VKQVMTRPRSRNRAASEDHDAMWAVEYARLRYRGYSRAEAARLATLHLPDRMV
jgi:hypothetical protein